MLNPAIKKSAWEKILGNAQVKRALEIACVGNHTITIISPPGAGENHIKKWVSNILEEMTPRKLNIIYPCPCGYYLCQTKSCHCTPSAIRKYRSGKTYIQALEADILVEMVMPRLSDYGKRDESWDKIEKRIDSARAKLINKLEYNELTEDAKKLLDLAIIKLGVSNLQVEQILSVASSILISELDITSNPAMTPAIAEAIQYQSPSTNNF